MTKPTMALISLDGLRADCGHERCPPCTKRRWLREEIAASPNGGKVSREQYRQLCVVQCRNSSHSPNGTCAPICMDQLGDAPGSLHGCNHVIDMHGKQVAALISALGLEIAEPDQCL